MIGKLLTVNKIQPWSPDNLRFHLVFQPFSKEKNLLNQEKEQDANILGSLMFFVSFCLFCLFFVFYVFICLLALVLIFKGSSLPRRMNAHQKVSVMAELPLLCSDTQPYCVLSTLLGLCDLRAGDRDPWPHRAYSLYILCCNSG